MKHPIKRSQFLKTLLVSFSAFMLDACRKTIAPQATRAPQAIATVTPQPSDTPRPTATPTPQLPDFCRGVEDAEAYLFGVGATRVKELETGVYQIVIDKNIDINAFSAQVEFALLAELDTAQPYRILWLDEVGVVLVVYDALYNNNDQQLSGEITGIREGDSGLLIPAMVLDEGQASACSAHPDFTGEMIAYDDNTYLSLAGLRFEPVLVKSRTGGGSSGSAGSSAGGTSGGTTTSGGPSTGGGGVSGTSGQ